MYIIYICVWICVKISVMTYVISEFLIVKGGARERDVRMKCFWVWVAASFYHFLYCFLFFFLSKYRPQLILMFYGSFITWNYYPSLIYYTNNIRTTLTKWKSLLTTLLPNKSASFYPGSLIALISMHKVFAFMTIFIMMLL